jgi:DNA-binding NtrC family response regulator
MLREEAYTVISASSLATALHRAGRHAPGAILVDCTSPDDGGAALLAVLQAEQPGLAERVILMGGAHASASGVVRGLSKPFTRQQLLAILRQLG